MSPAKYFGGFFLSHTHERVQLLYLQAFDNAFSLHQRDSLSFLDGPAGYFAHSDPAQERRIIEGSDLHLQWTFRYFGLGYIFQDTVQ